jgi:lipopolysaccharide/colanic/teichoic acid biosynthesis glycosyltransferase
MKRLFDIMVVGVGILFTLPFMVIAAAAIRLTMGSPVFFRQVRIGQYRRPFVVHKFRTMRDLRDSEGKLLPDEQRLTAVGRVFRWTHIDELPELFSVLRGEMSLVGPRPWLAERVNTLTSEEARRLEVKPGLTGWAQVNGNTKLSFAERSALDLWYIDHRSPWLDFAILLKTIGVIFLGERANYKALQEARHHAECARRGS